jgi:hypothetical protein
MSHGSGAAPNMPGPHLRQPVRREADRAAAWVVQHEGGEERAFLHDHITMLEYRIE